MRGPFWWLLAVSALVACAGEGSDVETDEDTDGVAVDRGGCADPLADVQFPESLSIGFGTYEGIEWNRVPIEGHGTVCSLRADQGEQPDDYQREWLWCVIAVDCDEGRWFEADIAVGNGEQLCAATNLTAYTWDGVPHTGACVMKTTNGPWSVVVQFDPEV